MNEIAIPRNSMKLDDIPLLDFGQTKLARQAQASLAAQQQNQQYQKRKIERKLPPAPIYRPWLPAIQEFSKQELTILFNQFESEVKGNNYHENSIFSNALGITLGVYELGRWMGILEQNSGKGGEELEAELPIPVMCQLTAYLQVLLKMRGESQYNFFIASVSLSLTETSLEQQFADLNIPLCNSQFCFAFPITRQVQNQGKTAVLMLHLGESGWALALLNFKTQCGVVINFNGQKTPEAIKALCALVSVIMQQLFQVTISVRWQANLQVGEHSDSALQCWQYLADHLLNGGNGGKWQRPAQTPPVYAEGVPLQAQVVPVINFDQERGLPSPLYTILSPSQQNRLRERIIWLILRLRTFGYMDFLQLRSSRDILEFNDIPRIAAYSAEEHLAFARELEGKDSGNQYEVFSAAFGINLYRTEAEKWLDRNSQIASAAVMAQFMTYFQLLLLIGGEESYRFIVCETSILEKGEEEEGDDTWANETSVQKLMQNLKIFPFNENGISFAYPLQGGVSLAPLEKVVMLLRCDSKWILIVINIQTHYGIGIDFNSNNTLKLQTLCKFAQTILKDTLILPEFQQLEDAHQVAPIRWKITTETAGSSESDNSLYCWQLLCDELLANMSQTGDLIPKKDYSTQRGLPHFQYSPLNTKEEFLLKKVLDLLLFRLRVLRDIDYKRLRLQRRQIDLREFLINETQKQDIQKAPVQTPWKQFGIRMARPHVLDPNTLLIQRPKPAPVRLPINKQFAASSASPQDTSQFAMSNATHLIAPPSLLQTPQINYNAGGQPSPLSAQMPNSDTGQGQALTIQNKLQQVLRLLESEELQGTAVQNVPEIENLVESLKKRLDSGLHPVPVRHGKSQSALFNTDPQLYEIVNQQQLQISLLRQQAEALQKRLQEKEQLNANPDTLKDLVETIGAQISMNSSQQQIARNSQNLQKLRTIIYDLLQKNKGAGGSSQAVEQIRIKAPQFQDQKIQFKNKFLSPQPSLTQSLISLPSINKASQVDARAVAKEQLRILQPRQASFLGDQKFQTGGAM